MRAILQRYGHWIWTGSLALASVLALAALIGFYVSGRNETDDAFAKGRRLVIALDTGITQGRRLTLDKPIDEQLAAPIQKPEEKKPEPEPVAPVEGDAPAETTSPTEPAATPDAATESAPAETPVSDAPPATPTAAPNTALTEEVNGQRLPVIGKDGTKPWRYYSKSYTRERNQPMVAIVVSGLGIGKEVTQEALQLPENFTVSFSPYTRDIAAWAPAIRGTGHELLIDLPLEPTNFPATDPGPNGLFLEKGPADAEKRLQWVFSRFPAFIGTLTPLNESFTANDEAIKTLLQSYANRGLIFMLSREPHRKETRDIVDANVGTATLISNVLIDEDASPAAIQQRLTLLEEQAKRSGYAIGVAQPYPVTIEQLREWAAKLEEKGVVLVPLSAIAKLRFS